MMHQPESGGAAAPAIVEDLFLTDAFLIKGRLPHKSKRLSNMLEDHSRTFLPIQDATMVALRSGEVIRTPSVLVNVREVVFAHELVDVAGDAFQKRLAHSDKRVRIRAFFNGAVQFELAGSIEPGAYDTSPGSGRKYFILAQPQVRGLNLEEPELQLLRALDYVIVRKDKLAYVYDLG